MKIPNSIDVNLMNFINLLINEIHWASLNEKLIRLSSIFESQEYGKDLFKA